ncbi:hypothetical protein MKX07_005425 [Trichoderma sp. CBMAI-0711]|nr:hypothetical protein MKX07_005425 [Trichoderma sp. CBMAI-0711]
MHVNRKWPNRVVLAILGLEATNARNLTSGKGHKVLGLRLAGNVLDQDVDLLLCVALLDRNDMHQVGVLEDWWGLEVDGQSDRGEGAARPSGQEAQQRRKY